MPCKFRPCSRISTSQAWLAALLLAFLPAHASCLDLSLGPQHYAEALEFYYKQPKPDLIAPMLRSFQDSGLLRSAQRRMFTAAFLAELARRRQLDLSGLLAAARANGRESRLTLAWAAHLSGAANERELLASLLGEADATALKQMKAAPRELLRWDPGWEASTLRMFWGAFMASGDTRYVDRIIDAALDFSKPAAHNRAAASLYDFAPRHPLVAARLRQRLPKASPDARETIHTILDQ